MKNLVYADIPVADTVHKTKFLKFATNSDTVRASQLIRILYYTQSTMDNVNLNAFTENAARLGMRIQETFSEHTRDLSITRGGASIFDMPDDKVKNIGKQLDSNSDREKLDAMKRLIAVSAHLEDRHSDQ